MTQYEHEQERAMDADTSNSTSTLAAAGIMTLDPAEVVDRIAVMRLQEESDAYRCVDYLAYECSGTDQAQTNGGNRSPIDADCRRKMCEWSTQVVDFCQFSRETVSVAMGYLDRFLSASVTTGNAAARRARVSRREYQLAAMTALYIAVKLREPLEMDTELVSELSRGCYTAREIANMEVDILSALQWRTSGPTPLGFLRHFLALLPKRNGGKAAAEAEAAEALLDLGRCQAELAAADAGLVTCRPSAVAVAALLNSLEAIDDATFPPAEKISFLRDVRDAIAGVDLSGDEVRFVRMRLREAFSEGAGCDLVEACRTSSAGEEREEPELASEEELDGGGGGKAATRHCSGTSSPICVSRR